MKVSREVMAEHKEQFIAASARRYRERGFEGISVADLMKEAGLTQGGFYRHFSSKDELITRSALRAVSDTIAQWCRIADNAPGDRLEAVVHAYISPCAITTSPRQDAWRRPWAASFHAYLPR